MSGAMSRGPWRVGMNLQDEEGHTPVREMVTEKQLNYTYELRMRCATSMGVMLMRLRRSWS